MSYCELRAKLKEAIMGKHDKVSAKIKKVMEEFKKGKLKSSSGKLVKKKSQAIAIALSSARKVNPKFLPKKR